MQGLTITARELTRTETTRVGAGLDADELVSAGATAAGYGASVGAFIGVGMLGFGGAALGAVMGGLVGGFLGGAYYAANELLDGCY